MNKYPNYGIDAPAEIKKIVIHAIIWSIIYYILFKLLYFWLGYSILLTLAYVIPALCVASMMLLVGLMYFSSKVGKFWQRDKLLKNITWKETEKVLDVGCGSGLLLIGAAKKLNQGGKAIGIDIWSDADLSNNTAELTLQNADLEGVKDRVEVMTADVRHLAFEDNFFDVIVSSLVIHNISSEQERNKALDELVRVLKPGGILLLQDIFYTQQYLQYLRIKKVKNVSLSSLQWYIFPPARFIKLIK